MQTIERAGDAAAEGLRVAARRFPTTRRRERFIRGVVLYPGEERLPFGERLEAWPLATLWSSLG